MHIQAAMTLQLYEYEVTSRNKMTYRMRRAKKEKMEAFLVIEVRIPKTMINGRTTSARSVSILVTSR